MDSIKNTSNFNTMNNNMTDNNDDIISMAAHVTDEPICKGAGELNLVYQAAARNLREFRRVPSVTAGGLEKTMALLQLRPARLVAQGLAPKDLLKDDSAPDADAHSSSRSAVESEQSDSQLSDDSNSGDTENVNIATQDGIEAGASKHPIHAIFVAAGVNLRPRETRPLLRALG
ncbi:unnamed protein product, partial [Ectocarpus sp. 12 AP-2014]